MTMAHDIFVGTVSLVASTGVAGIVFAALKHMISQVHHEVVPNSGASLRDAVDRSERTIGRVDENLRLAMMEFGRLAQRVDDHIRQSDEDHASLRSHLEGHR